MSIKQYGLKNSSNLKYDNLQLRRKIFLCSDELVLCISINKIGEKLFETIFQNLYIPCSLQRNNLIHKTFRDGKYSRQMHYSHRK